VMEHCAHELVLAFGIWLQGQYPPHAHGCWSPS